MTRSTASELASARGYFRRIPIWLDEHDIASLESEHHVNDKTGALTDHIDFLQGRNGCAHVASRRREPNDPWIAVAPAAPLHPVFRRPAAIPLMEMRMPIRASSSVRPDRHRRSSST